MAGGTLAAIGAGIASPLFMIFFSTISEIFVPGNEETAEGQGRDLFIKLTLVGILTWACRTLSLTQMQLRCGPGTNLALDRPSA